MSDDRDDAINEAVGILKKSGAETVSIIATWKGKDTRSRIVFPVEQKRGLGKGLGKIDAELKLMDKRTKVLG